jgi:hypothetical protein
VRPAERMRHLLAEERRRGRSFAAASRLSLRSALREARNSDARKEWAAALRWARPAFERAYELAEPEPADRAVAELAGTGAV